MHATRHLAARALVVAVVAAPAAAQSVTWDGGAGDGLWFTDSNWSPDGVPGDGADIVADADTPIVSALSNMTFTLRPNSIMSTGPGLSLVSGSLEIASASEINSLMISGCCTADITANAALTIRGDSVYLKRANFSGPGPIMLEGTSLFGDGMTTEANGFTVTGEATIGASASGFVEGDHQVFVNGTLRLENNATLVSGAGQSFPGGWVINGELVHDGTGVVDSACSIPGVYSVNPSGVTRVRAGRLTLTGAYSIQNSLALEDHGVIRFDDTGTAIREIQGQAVGVGDVEIAAGGVRVGFLTSSLSLQSDHGLRLISSEIRLTGPIGSTGRLTLGPCTLVQDSGVPTSPGRVLITGGEGATAAGVTSQAEIRVSGGTLDVSHPISLTGPAGRGLTAATGGTVRLRPGAAITDTSQGASFMVDGGSVTMDPALTPSDRIDITAPVTFSGGLMLIEGGELRIRGGMVWTGGEINLGQTDSGSVHLLGCCSDVISVADATVTGRGVFRMGGALSTDRPDIALSGTLTCSVSDDTNAGLGTILNTRVLGAGTIINTDSLELQSSARIEAVLINNGELSTSGTARVSGGAVNNGAWFQNNSLILQGGTVVNTGFWQVSSTGANITDLSGVFTNVGTYIVAGLGPGRIGHTIGVQLDNIGTVSAQNADVFVNFALQLDAGGVLSGGSWNAGTNSTIRFAGSVTRLTGPGTTLRGDGASLPEGESVREIDAGASLETTDDTDLTGGGPVLVEDGTLRAESGVTSTDGVETTGDASVQIGQGARLESTGPVRIGDAPTNDPPSIVADLQSVISLARRGDPPAPAAVFAPMLELWGRIIPGGEGGVAPLRIESNIASHPSSTWMFDLDASPIADTVHVTGNVTLDGTLRLAALQAPSVGDVFTIITTDGAITGAFDAVERLGAPGVRLNVVQTTGSVSVIVSCTADMAEPFGTLDFSDVFEFLVAFGAMSPDADLAEPLGTLDFSDVFAFLVAFGAGCQ